MTDKRYKVSIVTGVYNVEDYLEDMIKSILAQTIGFENVQLVLVDDGSKDKSGDICDLYASQYPDNIVAVHKVNGGVSSARNEGLKHAKGEYLNFADADDMLQEDALEKMYDFLKKNEERIDLVAVKLIFFGRKNGNHLLNYKFKKTRIIDLRKNYNYIQLAANSILVKRECFQNRHFDTELSYAEDAQVITDILLDKMRYGVISDTGYLYRKRETEDSALDIGKNNPKYYLPYIKRFIIYSLENAREKKGYIPQFVKYLCMYDLQWRLKRNPLVSPGTLTADEEKEYRALIHKAIQYIDNKIIFELKNMGASYKTALLQLKEENSTKQKIVFDTDDVMFCIEDIALTCAGFYPVFFESFSICKDEILFEGYTKYFVELEGIEVFLKITGNGSASIQCKAELYERERKCDFFMDKKITQAKGFRFRIKQEVLPNHARLQLTLRYQGDTVICKKVLFGKFFPLSNQLEKSYFYQAGVLLTYHEHVLHILKTATKLNVVKYEMKLASEILLKRNKDLCKGWMLRTFAYILKPFKRKSLWLISDRLTKADDNGEALFTHINSTEEKHSVNAYFVLDKNSEDYERLKKIGKVVPYHSKKYRVLSLLCDKIISSQTDEYVFNCFSKLWYLYKDILQQRKFVFLQHGVTQNDLSGLFEKPNKNISLFVTSTYKEYQSILEYPYFYNEQQVKLLGFPRYDMLYDDASEKKIITFVPTWRHYLTSEPKAGTDLRGLKDGFENSSYCQMYQQVFSDERLYEAAEKYHYDIRVMLHPLMPRKCIEYFNCKKDVQILEKSTRYREVFADTKLLVTDYSSTVFDFAYLRKPVLYYQQDIEEFYSGKHTVARGYFDYEKDGFGEVEYTAEALVDRIIEYMENGCQLKEFYQKRIENTFPFNDKDNCKRVYDEIRKL